MSFLKHDPHILAPGRFFSMVDVATALFAVWAVLLVTDTGGGQRVLLQLAWSLLLFVMFFRRGQDEFWDACWRRATSAALLALLVVPVVWAFGEGLVVGFTTEHARDAGVPLPPQEFDLSFDGLVAVLIAAFFATFHWTRIRGAL